MLPISARLAPGELKKILGRMSDIEKKQMPFATSVALNKTGEEVLAENRALMERSFDRPTRWTLNAFFLRRATKRNLSATVERKSAVGRRFYLEVQEEGGGRKQTGIERLIAGNLAHEDHIEAVVPARGAKRNAYGNIPSGQLQRALSGIGIQRDGAQNTTDTSRKRNAGRATYFVPRKGQLSPGVWLRKGKTLTKFLAFTAKAPRYSAKFPMEKHGRGTAARVLPDHMRAALKSALKTAR